MKKSGGGDARVTADNGRPLAEADERVKIVMRSDAAIQAGDLDTLGKLSERATAEMIKKADALQVWQHTRPKDPQFVERYWNATAATLTVKGRTVYPIVDDTVHYHMEKAFDGWYM